MDNKALIDALDELRNRLTDRDDHAHQLDRLDGETLPELASQLIPLLSKWHNGDGGTAGIGSAQKTEAPKKIGRPVGSVDKRPRKERDDKSANIASELALQALETIKASGPEGAPVEKLHTKPWVLGLLARTGKARKVNGNWVAA